MRKVFLVGQNKSFGAQKDPFLTLFPALKRAPRSDQNRPRKKPEKLRKLRKFEGDGLPEGQVWRSLARGGW
jgi:hypothetical protein